MIALDAVPRLGDCKVQIKIPVAWGEMDALGHVNNIVYFRYFESVRSAYFEKTGFWLTMSEDRIGPILASTSCRFRAALSYPDTVQAGTRVVDLSEDRFTMQYVLVSENSGTTVATGDGLIVCFDYGRNTKAPLPEKIRKAIAEIEGRTGFTG